MTKCCTGVCPVEKMLRISQQANGDLLTRNQKVLYYKTKPKGVTL
ncbi:hypothetical protein bpmyx0001_41870 [Bacillus pseudomycoides DSM 12442]|nr:hypothetical protein bpmyx0001_41870 [Bacillus pseudomycoides DSM 12442]